MTLAGTRPPTVDEWKQYEPYHRGRLAVKPGLTGMWQVSGRSDITDFEEVGKIRWKLTETSQEAGGNIGYAISRQYRGYGYGTILLKSLIDIAKSGNCPELLATVKKYNYASKHVMEKCSGELVRETDERWYYRLG